MCVQEELGCNLLGIIVGLVILHHLVRTNNAYLLTLDLAFLPYFESTLAKLWANLTPKANLAKSNKNKN